MALSKRGWSNVEAIMPKIKGAVTERMAKTTTNIDLSTAENWLLRPELVEICRNAVKQNLDEKHFSYPRGFSGDPDLLDAYCAFFNKYFKPYRIVEPSHLATAPGAMAGLDTLLYNICDPGDGVLIPGPYWNGFDFGVRVRSSVNPVLAIVPSIMDNFEEGPFLKALEEALSSANCPVKALMFTSPHNPLSLCYTRPLVEACVRFCEKQDLHFICDEVYGMSVFNSPDMTNPQGFESVLSLNLEELGVNPARVHVVWSMSKDFGQSGFRMGVTITQSNQEMAVAAALAAQMQVSTLSATFVTALLTAPNLDELIQLNKKRLAEAYTKLTKFFKEHDIPYIPCNAGLYVFAKIAPNAETWEDESAVIAKLKDVGVHVSPGKAYHGPENEKGWARIGFAVKPQDLDEAIRRMEPVFSRP
ncbi:1-aminocyclopropane-1-carboxylate synthase [Westerdykella ornata]|uniref:1-aminocyclopropane-1-carboxylate synthase n=1 Tax=Westerdykella ornata TaxID=318751 RepID=A0A6A6JL20_WESOR|nr:1-aminocyclopropane-1-carboxylate synthase [Westerdykella ornata]KAF2276638.1 1-aminocyclopropane-1-carboxylate synthase [Westerdykella ornata]